MTNFTLNVVNASQKFTDDDFFIIGKGIDPSNPTSDSYTSVESYFQFADGVGTLQQVALGTSSAPYSYPLSSFPLVNGQRVLQLPPTTSGRIYFSLGSALTLTVVVGYDPKHNPVTLNIGEPDPFNTTDANFAVIYDKIEFTYDSGGVYIDTTAVDFFSLPIRLEMDNAKVGLQCPRKTINDKLTADLTGEWAKLVVNFDSLSGTSLLRIVAPNKAIGRADATQNFDDQYLDPYISAVWTYYQANEITIDCTELVGQLVTDVKAQTLTSTNAMFTGTVSADGTTFNFVNSTGDNIGITPVPSSDDVFGAGGSFNAVPHTAQSVIVRDLASAMSVGLLPLAGNPTLNQQFFVSNNGNYYNNSALLPASIGSGPWYDLYAKALHSFGDKIYAFAYDDELGQDSTLHTSDPTVGAVVTIDDLTDTVIPETTNDPTEYTVTFTVGGGASGMIGTTPLVPGKPICVGDILSPFQITYNIGTGDVVYTIDILRGIATPQLAINVTNHGGGKVDIALPGAPSSSS